MYNQGGYGYANQGQWQGYQMQTYPIQTSFIEQYGPGIFNHFDRDRSGSLDMMEVPNLVNQLFQYLQLAPPNPQDVFYLMAQSDNGDRRLNYPEFRRMMYKLAGQNC